MTEQARIEWVESDAWGAREFLDQASRLARDGAQGAVSDEGRQVLLHTAAMAACDAVLAVNGRQVSGVVGGHQLRLAEAERLLPGDHGTLFDELDDARVGRNEVSYRAGPVAPVDVDAALRAVNALLALARAHVAPHLPERVLEED